MLQNLRRENLSVSTKKATTKTRSITGENNVAALSTNVCRLLFLAVEQAVEALLNPTLLILVLYDVTDRSLRPAVYILYTSLSCTDRATFIYLFNPQLDTMQIRTYNSKTLNYKHANCKTSRQSTNRCLHY